MNLYVATKFELKDSAKKFMDDMEAIGHVITYDWTKSAQIDETQAINDMEGVRKADAVIMLADQEVAYTGTLVEVGAALGLGKPVYVRGNASVTRTLFFKHRLIRHTNDEF